MRGSTLVMLFAVLMLGSCVLTVRAVRSVQPVAPAPVYAAPAGS